MVIIRMLVPKDFTIAMLVANLRRDLMLEEEQSLFLYAWDHSAKKRMLKSGMISLPTDELIPEVYSKYKSQDGFLYLNYQELETMG